MSQRCCDAGITGEKAVLLMQPLRKGSEIVKVGVTQLASLLAFYLYTRQAHKRTRECVVLVSPFSLPSALDSADTAAGNVTHPNCPALGVMQSAVDGFDAAMGSHIAPSLLTQLLVTCFPVLLA